MTIECDICGNNVPKLFKAKVEGTVLEVCEECLRYGEKMAEPIQVSGIARKKKIKPLSPVEDEIILVDNYGKLIIEARKKKNLTREEFAKRIKEKESVIRRVESGVMEPPDALAEKIERFLEIKLRRSYERKPIGRREIKGKLTLGDVVKIE